MNWQGSGLKHITAVLAIALLSFGLWFGEINLIKGWAGIAWLSGFNWASIPICILIALSCVLVLPKQAHKLHPAMFIVFSSILLLAVFMVARYEILSMGNSQFFSPSQMAFPGPNALPVMILICAWIVLSVGITVFSNRVLVATRKSTPLLLGVAVPVAIMLGLLTVKIIPAINGSKDAIHAVKMGYPVFWLATLVPFALRLGYLEKPPSK
jgi:hypothetical protein